MEFEYFDYNQYIEQSSYYDDVETGYQYIENQYEE